MQDKAIADEFQDKYMDKTKDYTEAYRRVKVNREKSYSAQYRDANISNNEEKHNPGI